MDIEKLTNKYQSKIKKATTRKDLDQLRIKLLGRKGIINRIIEKIPDLPDNERVEYGQQLNKAKNKLEKMIDSQQKTLPPKKDGEQSEHVYQLEKIGHLHPITSTIKEINQIFKKMGFSIYDGPEIETDEFCFQRLNVPPGHPSRDMQDTIYIKQPNFLLRTQTSSIEARLLKNETPPFKAAFPGRVYRNEKVNPSNHFIFHQYQGVVVKKNVSLKDLIGTLDVLFKHLKGDEAIIRYRNKYYPEVEPGLGIDLECFSCDGKGCRLCKGIGWIEIGGAGIIHPLVMEKAGIDRQKWRGFAFGLGLDRTVMVKHNIEDIRTLTGGNLAYRPN